MIISRGIESKIREHLKYPQITLIIGPRQVGKTTLMEEINNELKDQGEKTIILNLDIQDDALHFKTQSTLLKHLKLELGDKKGYVFIDEVQRKENAGRFFKGLYDMNLPYKFILSCSGSVELREEISESLAGRKQLFYMRPVTFTEFVDFKTEYKYSDKLDTFFDLNDPRLERLFTEYLQFGGYPRVILADTLDRKRAEMQEIYSSYLERDITQLLNIKRTDSFTKLITFLASQVGSGVSISELSSIVDLDFETVKNYLWYLEKTFIIQGCYPFYTNPRTELSKTPTYYFYDLGMRNYTLNRFTNIDLTLEGGTLFENFIFNLLIDKYDYLSPKVNYWRTQNGAEVDFILSVGNDIYPIEVKYKSLSKPKVGKPLYNFLSKYSIGKGYVVNLTFDSTITRGDGDVIFIPYNKFLVKNVVEE